MEKKKSFQMPHTYIIIFFVIVLAAVLTLFIPLGQYETKEITYMYKLGHSSIFFTYFIECYSVCTVRRNSIKTQKTALNITRFLPYK